MIPCERCRREFRRVHGVELKMYDIDATSKVRRAVRYEFCTITCTRGWMGDFRS